MDILKTFMFSNDIDSKEPSAFGCLFLLLWKKTVEDFTVVFKEYEVSDSLEAQWTSLNVWCMLYFVLLNRYNLKT